MLVMPKKHIASITALEASDAGVIGELVLTAKDMAEKYGVADTGYKLVFNVGRDGGQVIPHVHLHILGGKKMGE